MKKKLLSKITVLVGVSVLTLGGIAGCSSNKADTAKKNGPVELKIATWANEREAKEFDEIINKLNAKQHDYKLKQMVIPKDYYAKVQTMIAGKQAPDLMWLAQEYVPAYASNNALVDISSQLKSQKQINMDDYFSGSLDAAKYEGKTYGLPWIGQTYVVYYNKSMFKESGIQDPSLTWNWNDFHNTAKTLTKDDKYGFATAGSPPLSVFAWGEGGDIINKKGKVVLDSPETIKGLEVGKDIITDKSATMPYEDVKSMGTEQAFVNGTVGMIIGGANDDVERKVKEAGNKFEVGMAVMPSGSKEQVTFNWTASTVISSQTKNKEASFKALVDVTNEMTEWKVPTPLKSKLQNIAEINPYKAYALEVIQKSTEISRGFNNTVQQNEIAATEGQGLDEVILSNNNGKGNVNVSNLAKDVAKKLRKITE
ncbi:sugar ABC transporter substrate-binding protein [Bacillus sp. DX4.1]|uniref:ABC transporter substrate-binding protein n=1 Tax=Bacillus sp. DX4.1 TaxID=3055867 RepID=UPI0025A1B21A|nr:sugar ABC transporter substrate-binding protein [Bacillus sp. DX4.1]MDM5186768.1 sugar ABC transporter substrate-binding protein [Bacillus sp. DX4.1]